LSWHLTGLDKKSLDDEWTVKSTGPSVDDVRRFLRTEQRRTDSPAEYAAAIACR
jgi:hypothetical protein